jgi:ABC-type lipoprotein export system ATPase subunit
LPIERYPSGIQTMLQIQGVKKILDNALMPGNPTRILRLDQLDLDQGESLAITGPSGCGKTSLLHLIAGLLLPDEGVITLAGQQLHLLSEAARDLFRARHVGYIGQHDNLISSLTVLDNVMLGLRFSRCLHRPQWLARSREMIDRVGLGHRRHARPAALSPGERQRVAIARAMITYPQLVIADEPTASCDPATAQQVFRTLLDFCQAPTHTLLVATHDPQIAGRVSRQVDGSHLIRESDHRQ